MLAASLKVCEPAPSTRNIEVGIHVGIAAVRVNDPTLALIRLWPDQIW